MPPGGPPLSHPCLPPSGPLWGRWHPLEEGKHAAQSGMDLKSYAERAGKNEKTMHTKVRAWRVLENLHVEIDNIRDCWRNLAEIHAGAPWCSSWAQSLGTETAQQGARRRKGQGDNPVRQNQRQNCQGSPHASPCPCPSGPLAGFLLAHRPRIGHPLTSPARHPPGPPRRAMIG